MTDWPELAAELLRGVIAWSELASTPGSATPFGFSSQMAVPAEIAWAFERLPEAFVAHPALAVDDPDPARAAVLETVARAADSTAAPIVASLVAEAGGSWDELLLAAASASVRPGYEDYLPRVASLRPKSNYRQVRVGELPHAHNPFRCDLYGEFQEISRRRQAWSRRIPRPLHPLVPILRSSAGQRWDRQVVSAGHASCAIHRWDMSAANSGALALMAAVPEDAWNPDAIRAMAQHLSLENEVGAASLLTDPITWSGDGNVSNGQHRICVARHAGLETLLVAT